MDEKEFEAKLEELNKEIETLKADNESLKKEAERLKTAQSNASAEAADYKRKYKATLDEAEQKKLEAEEQQKAVTEELLKLKEEKRISIYTAKLLEVGYSPEKAASMAASLPDGVSDEFFKEQKDFLDSQKQKAKEEALNGQPDLTKGQPPANTNTDDMDKKIRHWAGLS